MDEKKTECNREYFPAAPGVTLTDGAKFKLMELVFFGRLTTDSVIRKYLAKLFGVHHVDFEMDPMEVMLKAKKNELWILPNSHREVSDSGIIKPLCEDKLREEGFELIPSNRSKGNLRVKDFKKHLFDFEKECTLTAEDFEKYKLDRYAPF